MLSLTKFLKNRKLQDFIAQEEIRGTGPISEAELNETASTVIKTPPQSDQTSRSLPRDDLAGKYTRPSSVSCASG